MIFITGADGQLGSHLQNYLKKQDLEFIPLNRKQLDISKKADVKKFFQDKKLSLLINAAAYTNVDQAEVCSEDAYRVNDLGVSNLAEICNLKNIPIIHISTDYVFDGFSDSPYRPDDPTNPICIYGKSKLAGERALIANTEKFLLIRTSWVFSEYGKNFFQTILRLAKTSETLKVISDQYGNPTYAGDLARAIVHSIPRILDDSNFFGTYHYGGDEVCSWYDFANEICEIASSKKIISKIPEIIPISSDEFISKAKRPIYSVLDSSKFCSTFNLDKSNWRLAIKNILDISNTR